jgi:HlyD family secretion protein
VPSEGASVRRGDELARVADLRSFRVKATISDVHVARISLGSPILVQVEEAAIAGRISQILPAIVNGTLSFLVALDEPSSPRLRPNLRVDVQVATAHKEGVLRLKSASFPTVDGRTVAYVIRGERAVRTPVELGVASFDRCEVLKGLAAGEEVVISDMKDYAHLTEVKIR